MSRFPLLYAALVGAVMFGPAGPPAIERTQDVSFAPRSLDFYSAERMVIDPAGSRTAASPAGQTIPGCVMKVVPCNYGHLYSGTFGWSKVLKAAASQHTENVRVTVVNGVASCSGTETETDNGRTVTGTIVGPALFAVEFEPDAKRLVYRITAACPTAAWPAIPADGVPATPSRPAELGHNDQNSEKQTAKAVAQQLLEDTISYPAPETDPINGVTGTVTITWSLKRS